MKKVKKFIMADDGKAAGAICHDGSMIVMYGMLPECAEPCNIGTTNHTGWTIPCQQVFWQDGQNMAECAGRIVYDFGHAVEDDAGNYDWRMVSDDTRSWVEIDA